MVRNLPFSRTPDFYTTYDQTQTLTNAAKTNLLDLTVQLVLTLFAGILHMCFIARRLCTLENIPRKIETIKQTTAHPHKRDWKKPEKSLPVFYYLILFRVPRHPRGVAPPEILNARKLARDWRRCDVVISRGLGNAVQKGSAVT